MSEYQFTTEVYIPEIGEDVEVELTFELSKAEKQTHWDPGCPAEAELLSAIDANGVDWVQKIDDKTADTLESSALERADKEARMREPDEPDYDDYPDYIGPY